LWSEFITTKGEHVRVISGGQKLASHREDVGSIPDKSDLYLKKCHRNNGFLGFFQVSPPNQNSVITRCRVSLEEDYEKERKHGHILRPGLGSSTLTLHMVDLGANVV
jgi:hypothetical protein